MLFRFLPCVLLLGSPAACPAGNTEPLNVVAVASLKGPARADRMASVAFSPDGSLLAAGSGRDASLGSHGEITLWHWRSKARVTMLDGHRGLVGAVAFSADGQWLAGGGYRLTIWDVRTAKPIHRWHAGGLVHAIVIMPDKKTLVTAARSQPYATVWDVAAETGLKKLFANQEMPTHTTDRGKTVLTLDLSRDGKELVMGGGKQPASLWDTTTWALKQELLEAAPGKQQAKYVGLLHREQAVFCKGDYDIPGKIVHLGTKQVIRELQGDDHLAASIAISPDGQLIAVAGMDDICLWSSQSGKLLWSTHGNYWSVAFSPDARHFAVGNATGGVTVYQIAKDGK
ncbi:MAG: hypothetical protein AB1705_02605 [Verrucomicrobiota bacterium]